jgi:GNAT superfamily N-acetyltransferase
VAEVTIRFYTRADHGAAVALIQATNIAENAFTGDRREERAGASEHWDVLLPRLAESGGEVLLAILEGAVVGLVAWAPATDDLFVVEELRRYGIVEELVVDAAWRRRGIATLLLEEVEARARQAGLPRLLIGVVAGNQPAEAAYARFGFRPHVAIMAKPLNQP